VEVEEGDKGELRVALEGRESVLEVRASGPGRYWWLEGTRVVTAEVEGAAPKLSVATSGQVLAVEIADAQAAALAAVAARAGAKATGPVAMRAPMPGRVVKILAKAGEEVKAGRGVLVVEAMKMENEIRAPRDGRVREIRVSEGTAVEAGQDLVVLE
jgi:biotin carboxyl carrier protein